VIGKFTGAQRQLPLLLRLLDALRLLRQLLLQPRQLAVQTFALFLRLLPAVGGLLAGQFAGRLFGAQLFARLRHRLLAKQRQALPLLGGELLLVVLPLLLQTLLLLSGVGILFFQQRQAFIQQRRLLLRLLLCVLQGDQRIF